MRLFPDNLDPVAIPLTQGHPPMEPLPGAVLDPARSVHNVDVQVTDWHAASNTPSMGSPGRQERLHQVVLTLSMTMLGESPHVLRPLNQFVFHSHRRTRM